MSLVEMIRRFPGRVATTVVLVLAEAVVELLLPLFIGIAINGLIADDYGGVIQLGAMGVAALVIGSGRRFYDTRAYAAIYEVTATELVEREQGRGADTSRISARTTLLGEFVEFLENSMPEIVRAAIGTVGILIIIASIDLQVFLACLGLFVLVVVIYWATAGRNLALNRGYNDELERQVSTIDGRDGARTRGHFAVLMRWNRRLSDLETVNYIAIWLGVIALLVYAPIEVIDAGATEYGFAFAAILYVFQYIEGLVALPLFIQQAIRLKEISTRLAGVDDPDSASATQSA